MTTSEASLDTLIQGKPHGNGTPSLTTLPLSGYECLAISGTDRVTFLQGQITNNCEPLTEGSPLLGAHLNLKGRVEASFIAFPSGDTVYLLCPDQQAQHLKALLDKYAAFSQVTLSVTVANVALTWQTGSFDYPPAATTEKQSDTQAIGHYAINSALTLSLISTETVSDIKDTNLANALLIRSGFYLVDTTQQGKWLPQELNYDKINGISFNKGCYKGQEVVARLHFKGKVKQRLMCLATSPDNVVNDPIVASATLHNETVFETSNTTIYAVVSRSFDDATADPEGDTNKPANPRVISLPYAIT